MAIFPDTLDYTDAEFDSIRLRLQNLIRSVHGDWEDFDVASIDNILLESIAFVFDVLAFRQDNQAIESRFTTSRQRKTALAFAKLLGYKVQGATAARAEVVFTLANVPTDNVVLPAGLRLSTRDINGLVYFELLEDVTILAGQDPPTGFGIVENSEAVAEAPVSSTGRPRQSYLLAGTPYLDGSLVVTAANGAYEEVDNLLSSRPNDRHYTVSVDERDRARVFFGDGINGSIPTGTIQMDYRTGGGTLGNVEPNSIKVIRAGVFDVTGASVTALVTNPLAAAGGTNRQSAASIRELGPASARTNTRSVSLDDFANNAEKVPTIARAMLLTSDQQAGLQENTGILYVVPKTGGDPTQNDLDLVFDQVNRINPKTTTFRVTVRGALYKVADIRVVAFLDPGASPLAVKNKILAALAEFFAVVRADGTKNPNVYFGYEKKDAQDRPTLELPLSTIRNVVRDVSGVRKLEDLASGFTINGRAQDLELAAFEFPKLGTVRVVNGDTGTIIE